MGYDIAHHTITDTGWEGHLRFRPKEYATLTADQRDDVRETLWMLIDPNGNPWPLIAPLYSWGDPTKLFTSERIVTSRVIPLDPSPLTPPQHTQAHAKQRAWVFATLQNHDAWIATLNAQWPITQLGGNKKTRGGANAGTVVPEAAVIQAYADARGMLVAPYKNAGSGWWRPRYTFALNASAVCYVGSPLDAELIGVSFTNALEDIEAASDADLDALVDRQREQFFAWHPTRALVLAQLDAAIRS